MTNVASRRAIVIGGMVLAACSRPAPVPEVSMTVLKATPILLAENVDACIAFWRRYGLTVQVSVPMGDSTGFAILSSGAVELMYQSFASAEADVAGAIEGVRRSIIYVEVASLNDVLAAIGDAPVVVPERTTSYGAREVFVRDPAGNVIGFAQQAAGAAN
jgi:hypothetical protein